MKYRESNSSINKNKDNGYIVSEKENKEHYYKAIDKAYKRFWVRSAIKNALDRREKGGMPLRITNGNGYECVLEYQKVGNHDLFYREENGRIVELIKYDRSKGTKQPVRVIFEEANKYFNQKPLYGEVAVDERCDYFLLNKTCRQGKEETEPNIKIPSLLFNNRYFYDRKKAQEFYTRYLKEKDYIGLDGEYNRPYEENICYGQLQSEDKE